MVGGNDFHFPFLFLSVSVFVSIFIIAGERLCFLIQPQPVEDEGFDLLLTVRKTTIAMASATATATATATAIATAIAMNKLTMTR